MSIIRVEKNRNYSVTHNSGARDKRLSWGAKGILWYALTRPDNWQLNIHDLKNWAPEGDHALKRMLGELKRCGYLKKQRERHTDGTWQWVTTLYEVPQDQDFSQSQSNNPPPENPPTDYPSVENPPMDNPSMANPPMAAPLVAHPTMAPPPVAYPSTQLSPPIKQTPIQQRPTKQKPKESSSSKVSYELSKNLPSSRPLATRPPTPRLTSAQRREHAWAEWISDLTD